MSLVTGALSSSKMLGLEDSGEIAEKGAILMGKEGEEEQKRVNGHDSEEAGEEERLNRQMSEMSLYGTEEEEEDEEGKGAKGIELGPRVSLKTEIEKDKVCLHSSSPALLPSANSSGLPLSLWP